MKNNNYPVPPSHRTFVFGKITIDSNFDGGNCSYAQKINQSTFAIWINPDHVKNPYRMWFHFSINGVNKNNLVTFQIKNMQNQSRLLYDGLVPVFRVDSNKQWKRISHKINLTNLVVTETEMEWSFSHLFTSAEKYQFAFYYPWSNEDNQQFLDSIVKKCSQNNDIYIHRGNIASTLEGRPVQMVTISSKKGLTTKDQNFDDNQLFQNSSRPKYFDGDKKYIIFGCRVHPGEIPGSHVLTGIIEKLTDNDQIAQILRDKFIFCIFPILNPDGVARGHYRVDTNGINLNRCYINPSLKEHGSIYAIKKIVMKCHKEDRYFAFLDLHAQASRAGNFIYGNSLNQLSKQVQSCLFPKILSLNSENFEYQASNFMQKHMYQKDKGDHISKQGCGRVAVYSVTKNPNSWTLQCSYNRGFKLNILQPKKNPSEEILSTNEQNFDINLIKNYKAFPTKDNQQFYTISSYRNLGIVINTYMQQMLQSLLDLVELNPYSRISNPFNYFKNITNLRLNLAMGLLKMAPNRFQTYFRKIYFIAYSLQNQKYMHRCYKALYLMLIKKAKLPNINQFIKDDDSTIIYPIEKPPSKEVKFRKNQHNLKLSLRKINQDPIDTKEKIKGKATLDSDNVVEFQSDHSFILTPGPFDQFSQKSSPSKQSAKTNHCFNKNRMPPEPNRTIKVIQIDKQIQLKKIANDQFKMIGIESLHSRYQSQNHITNFSSYKKKNPLKFQNFSMRKTYNEVFRLQILPKLLKSQRANMKIPSSATYQSMKTHY